MTAAPAEQDLDQLLARARTERLESALRGLALDEWAMFAAFPAWTQEALDTIIPSATKRLRAAVGLGEVQVKSRTVELRSGSGEREDFDGSIWWLDAAARAHILRTISDANLTEIVRQAARRLLASPLPLPFPTWRAATIAVEARIADGLRARVDSLLPGWGAGALATGKPDEAVAWIDAARYLAASLGSVDQGPLQLAVELAGRSVDLYHRRAHDLQQDKSFISVESVLDQIEAFLDRQDSPWGLHVLGQGGVGKTMLLRHVLLARASRDGWAVARVDFDYLDPAFPRREPWMLLVAIVAELRLQARTASDTSLFVELSDGVAHLAEATLPVGGDPFLEPLFHGVLQLLGKALAGRPTLLLLDTCEELERLGGVGPGSDAVTAMFRMLEEVKKGVPQLRVLLAGRRALAASGHAWTSASTPLPPRNWLAALELFGFCREHADALLERRGKQTNREDWPAIAEAIRRRVQLPPPQPVLDVTQRHQTHYLPYELALLAEWAATDRELTAAELANQAHDVYVERRIIPRLRRCLRRALPGLVACGTFDTNVVRCLVGDEEADVAWREASRQEWVVGDQWASIHPSFRARLDRYFSRSEHIAQRSALATKARAHLRARLDAATLATNPSAVEAWARAGRDEEDLACWQRWEAAAIAEGAWDWIERATERLLGPEGPAPRDGNHPFREAFLLSRAHATAALRPGLTVEWRDLWRELEDATSDPALRLRARGHVLSFAFFELARALASSHESHHLDEADAGKLEAYLREADQHRSLTVVAAVVTLLDATAEAGMGPGYVAWSAEVRALALRLLTWVLETDGAPLREEAAALVIRWSAREERRAAADRWANVACQAAPEGQPWEWPWREQRRGERLLELAISLSPSCERPSATLDRLRGANEENAQLLSFSLRAQAADPSPGSFVGDPTGRLMTRFVEAVHAPEPTLSLQVHPQATRISTSGELPPYWLAGAHELVQTGDFDKPIAFVVRELSEAVRRQSPREQYVAERILVDMLTWVRHPGVTQWKFHYLASSARVDDRLDAACFARLCAGESREPSPERIPPVSFLDLAWQAGAWGHAGSTRERLEELIFPLPDAMRMFVALVRGLGLIDVSEPPLELELDLVEAVRAFDEMGGRPPTFAPPIAQRVLDKFGELVGPEPSAAFRLAARASVVCDVPMALLDEPATRLGRRRAARLLRMEGERLALRAAGPGARLLTLASEWFAECDDRVGQLTSRILAELAAGRVPGVAPSVDAEALRELWALTMNTLPLGEKPGELAIVHAAGRSSPWEAWARRAMLALGEAGDDRVPELRGRRAPLNHSVLGTVARETALALGSSGPAWFREWLSGEVTTSKLHPMPPKSFRGDATSSEASQGDADVSRLKLRVSWRTEGDETDASVSIAAGWNETSLVRTSFNFEELRAGGAQLPDAPEVLFVDEGSASPLWEDLLPAPNAVRSIETTVATPEQLKSLATVLVTSGSVGERLGYQFWHLKRLTFVAWEQYIIEARPAETLHLFTRPTLGRRGVLLGTDESLRSGGVRSTGAVVDVMHLLRSGPRLVVLQLPVEHWEAAPEPHCGYLRRAAAELCQAGVPAVVVLPALPAELLFRLAEQRMFIFEANSDLVATVNHLRQAVREAVAEDPDPERRKAAARITLYLTRSLLDKNLPEQS